MDQATHNKIVSFIWGIADDVLRDLFKRGKYPDVILPMCVLRRLDAVLETNKQKVLDTKKMLDAARCCQINVGPNLSADRRQNRIRFIPTLRRRMRNGRHAHRSGRAA